MWEITPFPDVLPPLKRILPGIHKKKRRLQASKLKKDETQVRRGGVRKKCAICKQLGHNRSTSPHVPQGENVPLSFDQGQSLSHEQFVPPTQPSSCDVGENLPPSVISTQASTSNEPIST